MFAVKKGEFFVMSDDTKESSALPPALSPAPQKQEEAWKEEIAIMLAQAERRANSLPTKRSGDGW